MTASCERGLSRFEVLPHNLSVAFRKYENISGLSVEQLTRLSGVFMRYQESWRFNQLEPKLVDETWQTFWQVHAKKIGLDHELAIPACNRTTEELAALKEEKRGVVLLPDEIMQPKGLDILFQMFPYCRPLKTSEYQNRFDDDGGCVDVEMEVDNPYKDRGVRTVNSLQVELGTTGRLGQRLQTYIAASQCSFLMGYGWFDSRRESSLSAVFGSRRPDNVSVLCVLTHTDSLIAPDGRLLISSPFKKGYGFRTEGRKAS